MSSALPAGLPGQEPNRVTVRTQQRLTEQQVTAPHSPADARPERPGDTFMAGIRSTPTAAVDARPPPAITSGGLTSYSPSSSRTTTVTVVCSPSVRSHSNDVPARTDRFAGHCTSGTPAPGTHQQRRYHRQPRRRHRGPQDPPKAVAKAGDVDTLNSVRCRLQTRRGTPAGPDPDGTIRTDLRTRHPTKGCAACDESSRSPTARAGWARPR